MSNENDNALTLVLIARVPADGVEALRAYEDQVLPLLNEHGGRLELSPHTLNLPFAMSRLWQCQVPNRQRTDEPQIDRRLNDPALLKRNH